VDAKRPRALVGRAVTGNGNLHALVRAAFVSEIDFGCLIQRRKIEDRPDLLASYFERTCSAQSSTIGNLSLPQFSPSFFYIVSLVPRRWFVTLSECCDETRAE
jgi:hypothetical protein